jgi:MFS family permease
MLKWVAAGRPDFLLACCCSWAGKDVNFSTLLTGGNLSSSRALLAIYASIAISYLGVGLVTPLISIFLSERDVDSAIIGLVGTTMFTTFTVAAFPIGTATDRFGPKRILIGGLILYGIAVGLFATISDVWLFFAVRSIEGIGAAAISVATETMISQLSQSHERASRMSYYGLSVGLGWALGPLAGTSLFTIHYWLPFVANFALSIIAALLVAQFVPDVASGDHKVKGLMSGLSIKIAVPISAGALYGYLMSSLVTLFPLYLQKVGLQPVVMGTIITAVIIGALFSQVPMGKAADRFGKRRVLLICSAALAAIFTALPLRTEWWFFVGLGTVVGALAGSLYPLALAMLGDVADRHRLGSATSLFSLAFGIGSLTGPAISGVAMNHLGNKALFYLPSMLTAAFCILVISLYEKSAPLERSTRSNCS